MASRPSIRSVPAALLGGLAAALLSLPIMRLSGHYFALATLAFGEVMRVLANTWAGLTGGRVASALLSERFEDQVNIVRVTYGGRRRTLLFTRGEAAKALD